MRRRWSQALLLSGALIGAAPLCGPACRRAEPETPLGAAAARGQAERVAELLQQGADPNGPALIARGARPGRRSQDGVTALSNALGGGGLFDFTDGPPIGRCHPEVVSALLEADPALQLDDAWWLRWARRWGDGNGCPEALTLLAKGKATPGDPGP